MGLTKRWWDEVESRGFGTTDDTLCASHIRDSYLLEQVISGRTAGRCFVCDAAGSDLVEAESLLGAMFDVIRSSWEPASHPFASRASTMDLFYEYFNDVFDEGDPVEILERLDRAVTNDEWAPMDSGPWGDTDDEETTAPADGWRTFVKLVQHESRFVFLTEKETNIPDGGRKAATFVADFSRMLKEHDSSLVRAVPKGSVLYRGRMVGEVRDAAKVASAAQLGSAPKELAAANRMSPAGISMFYASETLETAVAEIATHDVDQRDFAVIGGFQTLRDLRILDLFDIDVPSVFDPTRASERADKTFLRSFARDITRPIRLDGREHREYAPTQILTELIRWTPDPAVNGIRLRSSQDQQATYVLFFGQDSAVDLPSADNAATFGLHPDNIAATRVKRSIKSERVPAGLWQSDVMKTAPRSPLDGETSDVWLDSPE